VTTIWKEPAKGSSTLRPVNVWRVKVCSFTFTFDSIEQLEQYLDYYSGKIHPTSRIPREELPNYGGDQGETQRWFERLPMYLLEEPKRKKVVVALTKAAELWRQEQSN
jgi:hypothetical protein